MRTTRLLFAISVLLTSVASMGQPAKPLVGRIVGTVATDGLSLPGVIVTVRGPLGTRATVTSEFGSFVVDGLPLGAVYEVTAELVGFVKQKQVVALTAATASHDTTFELQIERDQQADGFKEMGPTPVEVPLTFYLNEAEARLLPGDGSLLSIVSLSPGVH